MTSRKSFARNNNKFFASVFNAPNSVHRNVIERRRELANTREARVLGFQNVLGRLMLLKLEV